ncbi:MAG: hypothetical protein WCQ47_08175 [bacterium]
MENIKLYDFEEARSCFLKKIEKKLANLLEESTLNNFEDSGLYDQKAKKEIEQTTNQFCEYLKQKCKEQNLDEKNESKSPHQIFWEEYLANLLIYNGLDLKKDKRDGAPDFYFNVKEDNNRERKIHIEAKAPECGINQNTIRPVPEITGKKEDNNGENFGHGIAQPEKVALRFTSIIEDTIEKQIRGTFQKSSAVSEDDYIVLAINGHEVVDKWEGIWPEKPIGHHLVNYALSNRSGNTLLDIKTKIIFEEQGELKKYNGEKIRNDYFLRDDTPIHGIIYSNVSKDNCLYKSELVYIQNPNKENLSKYFKFLKKLDLNTLVL